jgi:hypothetical protein
MFNVDLNKGKTISLLMFSPQKYQQYAETEWTSFKGFL